VQLAQLSPLSQVPLPQTGGQSARHLKPSSTIGSHTLSPQFAAHAPQSAGHSEQLSPLSQLPFPQTAGQSTKHDFESSIEGAHTPSPQMAGHSMQSPGQFAQVSAPSQTPLPQLGSWQSVQVPPSPPPPPPPPAPPIPPPKPAPEKNRSIWLRHTAHIGTPSCRIRHSCCGRYIPLVQYAAPSKAPIVFDPPLVVGSSLVLTIAAQGICESSNDEAMFAAVAPRLQLP
jgi:hypothetical protein